MLVIAVVAGDSSGGGRLAMALDSVIIQQKQNGVPAGKNTDTDT
jgi:hypothetical protein